MGSSCCNFDARVHGSSRDVSGFSPYLLPGCNQKALSLGLSRWIQLETASVVPRRKNLGPFHDLVPLNLVMAWLPMADLLHGTFANWRP